MNWSEIEVIFLLKCWNW